MAIIFLGLNEAFFCVFMSFIAIDAEDGGDFIVSISILLLLEFKDGLVGQSGIFDS
jgi:hypothetical protein